MSGMGGGGGRGRGQWYMTDENRKPGDSGIVGNADNENSFANNQRCGGNSRGGDRPSYDGHSGGYNDNRDGYGDSSNRGHGGFGNDGRGGGHNDRGRQGGYSDNRGRGGGGFNRGGGGGNNDRRGFSSDRGGFGNNRGFNGQDSGREDSNASEQWQPENGGGTSSGDQWRSNDSGSSDRGRGQGRGGFNRNNGGRNGDYRNFNNDEEDVPSGGHAGGNRDSGDRGGGGRGRGFGRGGSGGGRNFNSGNNEENGSSGNWNSDDGSGRGGGGRGCGGGRGGFRGGRGGGYGGDNDRDSGFSCGSRGGGFGGRGGRGGSSADGHDRADDDGQEPTEERPPPYRPPEKSDEFDESSCIKSGINFSKYDDIKAHVTGDDVPHSISSFEESGLRESILKNVKRAGYVTPTPIQKNAIPVIMYDRDVMSCAQTGSGKTAAYLLPMVHKMIEMNAVAERGATQMPLAVILVPTRELADQIDTEARKFAHGTMIKSCVVYGGTSVGYQMSQVERGVHIVVATTGRFLDVTNRGKFSFERLKFLVLDEADRMLDMGFRPNVEELLAHPTMPPKDQRQTLMFSATFGKDIQELAREMLNRYIFVTIGIVGGANEDVDQRIIKVTKQEKAFKIVEVVDPNEKVLIFINTKKSADFVASRLSLKDIPTTSIHGDRHQYQREQALREFRTGQMKALVATNVASRGLDIKDVHHVVNYDMPTDIDEYVHRIGRTGRVGNEGRATSFYDPQYDSQMAPHLVRILKDANKEVPDFLLEVVGDYESGGNGRNMYGGRDIRHPQEYGHRSNTDHCETDQVVDNVTFGEEVWG